MTGENNARGGGLNWKFVAVVLLAYVSLGLVLAFHHQLAHAPQLLLNIGSIEVVRVVAVDGGRSGCAAFAGPHLNTGPDIHHKDDRGANQQQDQA